MPGVNPGHGSSLSSVSCRRSTDCVAVGEVVTSQLGRNHRLQAQALIETWNGVTWTAPRVASLAHAALVAVSCPTARFCMAVGTGTGGPLSEVDRGGHWTPRALPNRSLASSVSCTTPASCIAVGAKIVGTRTVPTAAYWHGAAWTAQAVPDPAGPNNPLVGVSCATATRCVAVGYSSSKQAVRVFAAIGTITG